MKTHEQVIGLLDKHAVKSKRFLRVIPLFAVIIATMVVSGGLLGFFMRIESSIFVSQTAITSDGQNMPISITKTFENATSGDIYYTDHNFTNTKDNCFFNVSFNSSCDPEITITLLNESDIPISFFIVDANETRHLKIMWEISLLAVAGNYNASTTFEPVEGAYI